MSIYYSWIKYIAGPSQCNKSQGSGGQVCGGKCPGIKIN